MRTLWNRLPAWLKNFYTVLGGGFLVWMLLFDAEDLSTQYKLHRRVQQLKAEIAYNQAQITKTQQDLEELDSDQDLLEKFAREKFFMKKKTEDLYIITEE